MAPQPRCPIRPGDACSLCVPGATGPQDCPLVYLVMSDPVLREELRLSTGARRKVSRRRSMP
ncbi:DUF6767 domain-containing protein [Kribbella sp. NPDC050459]|uniref:DUF6767 domain-containing protein n=1 Tax=Kribbella sp. NPDC050459 TaxID=3155785 RepID=UPI0033E00FB2